MCSAPWRHFILAVHRVYSCRRSEAHACQNRSLRKTPLVGLSILQKKWVDVTEVNERDQLASRDMCPGHIANISCPLKAGAPIYMTWPMHGKFKPSLYHTLTYGMVQLRYSFLHSNGKPFVCFKIPIDMWVSLYSDGLHLELLLDSSICYFTDISSLFSTIHLQ